MRKLQQPGDVPLDGVQLIEASAGCGKTYTLVELGLRLLEEGHAPSQLLVVTYTRAATAELKVRFRRRLLEVRTEHRESGEAEPAWLARAVARLDELTITTLHGFCQRALGEFALESEEGLSFELLPDLGPLEEEIAQDLWVEFSESLTPEAFARLEGVGAARPDRLAKLIRLARGRPGLRANREAVEGPSPEARALARQEVDRRWGCDRERLEELLLADPRCRMHLTTIQDKLIPALDAGWWWLDAKVAANLVKRAECLLAAEVEEEDFLHGLLTVCGSPQAEAGRLRLLALESGAQRLEEKLLAAGQLGYDDLLRRLHAALVGPGGERLASRLRTRYRVALVDEFQDTDPFQAEILSRVFARHDEPRLFFIGDPKQAIYGFRGADIQAYLEAAETAEEPWSLPRNWRSDPGLLRGVEAVFRRKEAPFRVPRIDFVSVEARPHASDRLLGPGDRAASRLAFLRTEGAAKGNALGERMAELAADRALALLGGAYRLCPEEGDAGDSRRLDPGDLAILCRTHREGRRVQEALRARGLPSARAGDQSVLETDEAQALEQVLAAWADPGDAGAFRTALANPLVGLDAAALLNLQEDDHAWDRRIESFRAHGSRWQERGVFAALQEWMNRDGVLESVLRRPGGARAATNLLHLQEVLHEVSRRRSLGPRRVLEWLRSARRRGDAEGLQELETQLRAEGDGEVITVATIHRSKGLEYPVVLLPYAWSSGSPRAQDAIWREGEDTVFALDGTPGDDEADLLAAERLEEQLRLLYVALTRARHRCEVLWPAGDAVRESALGWLLHAEEAPGAAGLRRSLDALKKKLKSHPDLVAEDLRALAAGPGEIELLEGEDLLRGLAEAEAPSHDAREDGLSSGARPTRIDHGPRGASFTSLVRGAEKASDRGRLGIDDDELAVPANGGTRSGTPASEEGSPQSDAELPLARLPAGAATGILVHAILEHADFRAEASLLEAIRWQLRTHPRAEEWTPMLLEALSGALAVPILDPGHAPLVLSEVAREERLDEMEFFLAARRTAGFTARALADLVERHGWPREDSDLPARLRRLDFALEGWLHGYQDLVVCRNERWWVLDYKTNRLGKGLGAYRPEALEEEVASHGYDLQLLLYGVALHLHLQHRLPGYEPEAHLAGGGLLFLRGRVSGGKPEDGLWRAPYPASLMDEAAALLAPGGRAQ